LSSTSKVILGKERLNESGAFAGGKIRVLFQKVTDGNQTFLQGSEFRPFHSVKFCILDVILIDVIESMISLTEIIDPRKFWEKG
jgi:hypothetical protein